MSEAFNSHKNIFLADDDEDDRMLFMEALGDLEFPAMVNMAVDGVELLDMLFQNAQQLPDIIFLDINMPGKNGFECLREIRSSGGRLKEVRIIMLSTSRSPENIDLSYELGADLYAVKPSTFQALKELLLKIFQMDWSSVQKQTGKFLLA